ncbi:MAG: cytochrome c biogenesis protein CcdA [Candidatus Bathyarchaeia archaeon]
MKKAPLPLTSIAVIFLCIINVCWARQPVYIEFLYRDNFCQFCPDAVNDYMAYVHNREVLLNIERDYGENVTVVFIPFFSEEGLNKVKQYNLSLRDWNSIVVNHKCVLGGGDKHVNESLLRELIDLELASLNQSTPLKTYTIMGAIVTAFILGFFESFSPCVLIMLSFIVGYALGDKDQFQLKEGFLKVMTFGAGFILSSLILGATCGLLFFSMPNLQLYLTLVVCFFAIIFGFNLLGLLKFPMQSKPLVSKIARKYVLGYLGIFLLGLMFYFLDPCISPIFASMAAILFSGIFTSALFFFCLGAIIPFIGAGLFVSSISKITRKAYKHRFLLRGLSGLILIGYASYLLYLVISSLL